MAIGPAVRVALLGGALACALLAPGCAASPVRERCEAARQARQSGAEARRCAALRASSWRSSSAAAAGRRGIMGRR